MAVRRTSGQGGSSTETTGASTRRGGQGTWIYLDTIIRPLYHLSQMCVYTYVSLFVCLSLQKELRQTSFLLYPWLLYLSVPFLEWRAEQVHLEDVWKRLAVGRVSSVQLASVIHRGRRNRFMEIQPSDRIGGGQESELRIFSSLNRNISFFVPLF